MDRIKSSPIIVLSVLFCVFMFNKYSLIVYNNSQSIHQSFKENVLQRKYTTKDNVDVTCLNTAKTDCYPVLRQWMDKLVARRAPMDDPELIDFTRVLIDPPATRSLRKLPWGARSTPQAEYVDKLLGQMVRFSMATNI